MNRIIVPVYYCDWIWKTYHLHTRDSLNDYQEFLRFEPCFWWHNLIFLLKYKNHYGNTLLGQWTKVNFSIGKLLQIEYEGSNTIGA